MESLSTWKDIVKDWEKVSKETHEFIFSQVKDRYDDCLSESVSITEKSINLLKLSSGSLIGFVSYNFVVKPGLEWIIILGFLFLVNLILLGCLMFPKGVSFRGSPPNEIYCNYLDNSIYDENDKRQIVYYHEIVRYQARIDSLNKLNNCRQWLYGFGLVLTIANTLIIAGLIISLVISRP